MKIPLLLPVFLLLPGVSGEQLPDLNEFTDAPAQAKTEIVFMDDFENQARGWSLPRSFRVEKGAGRNLTNGLSFERKNLSDQYEIAGAPLKLNPGGSYQVTVYYRLENIASAKGESIRTVDFLAVEFMKGGKYDSGKYHPVPFRSSTTEWERTSFTFTVPRETSAFLRFYLNRKLTGKICIDDVIIQTTGDAPSLVYPLFPRGLRIPADGKFKFFVNRPGGNKSGTLLYASLNGTEKISPVKENIAEFDFGSLSAPSITLKTMVLEPESRRILGRDAFMFYASGGDVPANAAEISEHGHLVIGGEKFLPLGIFTSRLTGADVGMIAGGGFNCVLRYAPLDRRSLQGWESLADDEKTQTGALRRLLDSTEKHNLKLIFSLYEQRGGKQATDKFDSVEGVDAVTEHAVENFKNHPALLAWLISDENPVSEIPRLMEMRKLVSRRDPFHPVLTLTHRMEDYLDFGQTGDVFLIDQYPIQDDRSRSMAELRRHISRARLNRLPLWMVVQAFNWGAYKSPENFADYRYPTESEMRSMALLGLNHQVTGILFFSYSSIFVVQDAHDPERTEAFWKSLTGAVRLIRRFESFFLSTEKAPEIEVSVSRGQVEAKAYAFNGKNIVVITGDGPGECEAEITVPADSGLKSACGSTRNLGNGKYLFSGKDICSDIIY